jgi:hypothetical protein
LKNKIKLAISVLFLVLNGCATAREEHFYKKHQALLKKYNVKTISDTKIAGTYTFSAKKTKKMLAFLEHEWALFPDTIRIHKDVVLEADSQRVISKTVDSIYTNEYKIRYIKKHKLKSPNMHFSLMPDTILSSEDKHVHVADSTETKILNSLP